MAGFSEFVSGRYPALVRYGVLLITADRVTDRHDHGRLNRRITMIIMARSVRPLTHVHEDSPEPASHSQRRRTRGSERFSM